MEQREKSQANEQREKSQVCLSYSESRLSSRDSNCLSYSESRQRKTIVKSQKSRKYLTHTDYTDGTDLTDLIWVPRFQKMTVRRTALF
jgi:hypothetical protein